MTRPLRIEYPGGVYHVTSRGNAREDIFLSDADREGFLSILSLVVRRYNWLCHGYCLMSNHYHLLIETPEGNLSRGMRQLNGIYTQRFNREHNRVGHIFQGRYKAIIVEKDAHLLELSRYLVLNPVRAGMVDKVAEWKWSNYRYTAGVWKRKPDFLVTAWVLEQFGKGEREARSGYQKFVREGIEAESPLDNVRGQIFLGGEKFVEKMKKKIEGGEKLKEIPREQRYAGRPSLERIVVKKRNRDRDEGVYKAHVEYGYTLKEIGLHLGVHYSTVSRIIKSKEKEMFYCKT